MKKTLLIVDQDAYYAGIYANRFEAAGWEVTTADSLDAAQRRVEKQVPDVLIIDLHPVDETLAFLRGLRADDRTSSVLQIALTTMGDRGLMLEAQAAGVDNYLLKGHFVPSEAVQKVKRLLEEQTSYETA